MTTLDEALAAIRKQTKDRKELMDTLPKREWIGLDVKDFGDFNPLGSAEQGAYWAERKLKEKNHAV